MDSTLDWVAFLDRREAEGVRRIAVNVLALMISVFEAAEMVPHLTAALAPHLHEVVLTSRQGALVSCSPPQGSRQPQLVSGDLPGLVYRLHRLVLGGGLSREPP